MSAWLYHALIYLEKSMRFYNFFVTCVALFFSMQSFAAISLASTRVILNSDKKEASINVINDGGKDVVIQSWLEQASNSSTPPPFAVTPPLSIIKGNQQQLLRILFEGRGLPEDRESVFWLSVQEIPQLSERDSILQLAVMQRVKLFYRPASIANDASLATDKMTAKIVDGQLQLNNPTPFHINIINLAQDKEKLDVKMISPFETRIISANMLNPRKKITATVVNDYGGLNYYKIDLSEALITNFTLIDKK
ncbi:TPA: molecular chaperone [Aeromonas hydrophila]|uniref:fimbrial biogenesis chaperone n=1 Tax=Aeromonas TaxID=642 RepID=UPI00159F1B83|nr:molecular chaperone [Aeromonas caviae]HDZ8915481.1 molecular chaperone [Aeromonas hydrophila]